MKILYITILIFLVSCDSKKDSQPNNIGNINLNEKKETTHQLTSNTLEEEQKVITDPKEIEVKAKEGISLYQYKLGILFQNEKKYDKSFPWLKKAADQNEVLAYYELAKHYRLGWYVEKDEDMAISLFKQAAKQGHVPSMRNLGNLTNRRDLPESLVWYQRAAEKGDYTSRMALARYYKNGYLVEKDIQKAIEHYEIGLTLSLPKKVRKHAIKELKLLKAQNN